VQDQNYMYKIKTSLQKASLHNHMSIFFNKIISMSSEISQHLWQ